MTDDDRLLSSAKAQGRVLDDGCSACNGSKVYCRCVNYIEGNGAKCCPSCSHAEA